MTGDFIQNVSSKSISVARLSTLLLMIVRTTLAAIQGLSSNLATTYSHLSQILLVNRHGDKTSQTAMPGQLQGGSLEVLYCYSQLRRLCHCQYQRVQRYKLATTPTARRTTLQQHPYCDIQLKPISTMRVSSIMAVAALQGVIAYAQDSNFVFATKTRTKNHHVLTCARRAGLSAPATIVSPPTNL